MESKMIGLFFGSFDPVHIGHVNVVTAALNSGYVDNVVIVPAYKSVWKNTETSFNYRVLMCKEAFKGIPNIDVGSIEQIVSGGQASPTYKTIDWFKRQLDDFVIITTPETYKEIPQWQRGEDVMLNNKFLIVNSAHFDDVEILDKDDLIYAPNITICSTNLRQKIKDGEIVRPFIQDDVVKIINALELYK